MRNPTVGTAARGTFVRAAPLLAALIHAACGGDDSGKERRPAADAGVPEAGTPAPDGEAGLAEVGPREGEAGVEAGPEASSEARPPITDGPPAVRCGTSADCADGETCAPLGLSNGRGVYVCVVTCGPFADRCAAGEVCDLGVCRRPCRPFEEPSGCGEGFWCPSTTEPAKEARCLPAGDLPDGALCDVNVYLPAETAKGICGPGLVCRDPTIPTVGRAYCAPACDLNGVTPGGRCGSGETCRPAPPIFVGACDRDCRAFGDGSDCPEGTQCFPFDEVDATHRWVQGRCVKPGDIAEGERCGRTGCGAGLACSSTNTPIVDARCRLLCDATRLDSCDGGETCVRFTSDTVGDADIGSCQRTCALWSAGTSPCEAGEWCAPSYALSGSGICSHPDEPGAGSCPDAETCPLGSLCSPYGWCERVCNPDASPGAPGTCGPGTCVPAGGLVVQPPGLGFCSETCDAEAGTPCSDPSQLCLPAFLTGTGDRCVTPASCEGEVDGRPCGAFSACLDWACSPVCRIGSPSWYPHPDCPADRPQCSAASAPSAAFGYCEPHELDAGQ